MVGAKGVEAVERALTLLECFGHGAAELPEVRADGYAMSMGERDPEVAAMAVPLLAQNGALLGALSLSGPITRFAPALQTGLLAELMKSAARLGDVGPL